MRILILEDEPLIAMDLEDIVTAATPAECVWARNCADGFLWIGEGVDFALLDFDLGSSNSLSVAIRLDECNIPFCFVSGSLSELPQRFQRVPRVSKPFIPSDIHRVLRAA